MGPMDGQHKHLVPPPRVRPSGPLRQVLMAFLGAEGGRTGEVAGFEEVEPWRFLVARRLKHDSGRWEKRHIVRYHLEI